MTLKNLKIRKFYIYTFIYAAIIFVFHLLMRDYHGDTNGFYSRALGGTLSVQGLVDILKYAYTSYTSRIIVEIPLFIIATGMHTVIFAITDTFMMVVIYIALCELSSHRHDRLMLCLILLYPIIDMESAGWITACISYTWPIAAGLTALISLKRLYYSESIPVPLMILFMACELYGTNLEVMAALYLGMLVLFTVIMAVSGRLNLRIVMVLLLQYVICLFNIILAFMCPGNWIRNIQNIYFWFPDYNSLTFIDKAVLGFNTTASFLIDSNILWFILVLSIFILTLVTDHQKRHMVVLSAIPVAATLIRTALSPLVDAYAPDLAALLDTYRGDGRVDPTNYTTFASYLPFLYYALIVLIVLYCIINLIPDLTEGIILAYTLLLGLATRIMLGFSPSVYASAGRTFLLCDMIIILLCVLIYDRRAGDMEPDGKLKSYAGLSLYLLVFFSVVSDMISISTRY